jgi:hypothetical protein
LTPIEQAGGLKYYVNEWKKLTDDNFVIRAIKGFTLPFCTEPQQEVEPKVSAVDETEFIESATCDLLIKAAIIESDDKVGQFVSNIFTVPKPDGSRRFIINLKKLNTFLDTPHFKMEDIRTAITLVRPNVFMTVIDQKDAYYRIPVRYSNHSL